VARIRDTWNACIILMGNLFENSHLEETLKDLMEVDNEYMR
jgi:hypothetical protein